MSRSGAYRFLLVVAVVVVAGVCIRLGFWQLDRLQQRRDYNALLSAAGALPPLSLSGTGLATLLLDPDDQLYRRATASGTFDSSVEFVLRGRSHEGRPGVHLVAPFRLDSGPVVLVNLGWLPSPDGATIDPRPYRLPGARRLEGTLQVVPIDPEGAVPLTIDLGDADVETFRRLDLGSVAARLGEPVLPLYLQLSSEADSAAPLPIPIPPPALDEGPHLGYAIQWFSFAAIAVIGFLFVALMRFRESRGPH